MKQSQAEFSCVLPAGRPQERPVAIVNPALKQCTCTPSTASIQPVAMVTNTSIETAPIQAAWGIFMLIAPVEILDCTKYIIGTKVKVYTPEMLMFHLFPNSAAEVLPVFYVTSTFKEVVGAQNPPLDADELMSVEDPLGVSHTDEIEQFLMPLDDLLEVSYTDDVQYLLMPVDDPLGVSYADEVENLLMPVDDPLGISYADEVENLLMPLDDPLGVSFTNTASDDYFLDDLSISGPLCASTPCKPDTSRVSAVTTPQRSFKNFLEREVNSAQKMKNKALEASSIADALNYKCSCNNQCLKDYTFRQIRSERKAFWEKPQMERRYYYQKRDASRTQQETYLSLIIDGMDQAKTSLPHFAGRQSKSISNVDLLKTHVTGVINHGNGGFHSYVEINQFPHDPNLTINILLRALKKSADKQMNFLPPVLYLQFDNCCRENKNHCVLAFAELLIHISFLMVGHTHEDVDAQFSLISRTLKTKDCETIESLMTVCNGEHMHTVYDVKNWILPNANKFKLITTPLHYKFQKKDGTINVCYKGLNSQDWILLDGHFLNKLPIGKPHIVIRDFSKISVEKSVKQIETIKNLFNEHSNYVYWTDFYQNLNRNAIEDTPWILPLLPRQSSQIPASLIVHVPETVQAAMEKELRIPVDWHPAITPQ
ncbi:hypothetical protein MAR_004956 [Mya arenaria]|uniref:DUF7869 domain-containing protein n=1 Tax=Mya arenaria TaxID=6604 RepID=A0ABY7F1A9_MYAAR|nr:hypothetical protein MAR_004956 [Mya arenaria]